MEIFGLLLGILSVAISAASQQATNEQNIALARENREDQQAFATNAAQVANRVTSQQYYNLYSPESKVNQLRQAGLSVGLAYGNMGGVGGSAAQAATPSQAAPVVNPLLQIGSLMDAMEAMKTSAETKKTEKETDEIEVNIEKAKTEIKEIETKINCNIATEINTKLQNELAKVDLEIKTETKGTTIKHIKKELELLENAVEESKQRIKAANIELKYKDEYLQKSLDLMDAQYGKYIMDTYLAYTQTLVNKAEAALKHSQKGLTEQQKLYYKQLTEQVKGNNAILAQRVQNYKDHFFLMEKGGDWKSIGLMMGLDEVEKLEKMVNGQYDEEEWDPEKGVFWSKKYPNTYTVPGVSGAGGKF